MTATDPAAEIQSTPVATKRRTLTMLTLSLIFAIWIAALLTMYFATVYPQRHPSGPAPATRPI